MIRIKDFFATMLNNKFFEKLAAYALLIAFIYFGQHFLGIFLLTFLFAYLFLSLWKTIKKKIELLFFKIYSKYPKLIFLKKCISLNLIIIFLYVIFVWFIIYIFSGMIPKLINELSTITRDIPFFQDQISSVTKTLTELKNDYSQIWWTISQVLSQKDYQVFISVIYKIKSAGIMFFQVILALILSLVFLIDRQRLWKYLWGIKKSNFKFLYIEYKIILEKVANSFGLIFKAQSMIALVNSLLTVVWLIIIWYVFINQVFPYLLIIWIIVFVFSFIPVLGVFLSSIPIMLVAYNFGGGINSVLAVMILVAIVHFIEAYYLNPKIVSSFLELPVSLTFMILVISEYMFGFAWLLIWVSLFYFIIGLLKDADKMIGKTKRKLKKDEGKILN